MKHLYEIITPLSLLLNVALIITLIIVLTSKNSKENLCLCEGPVLGEPRCVDRDEQRRKYNSGMTEYSIQN